MKKICLAFFATLLIFATVPSAQLLTEDFNAAGDAQIFPPTDWRIAGTTGSTWTGGQSPYEGAYNAQTAVLAGGIAGLFDTVFCTVPLTDPILEFYYRGGYSTSYVAFTAEVSTTRWCPSQFVPVWDSGAFSLPDYNDPYTSAVVDMSAYAGMDVLVGFRCYQQDSASYPLFLDNVMLGSRSVATCFGPESFTPSGWPPAGWNIIIPDAGNPNGVTQNADQAYDGTYNCRFSSYSSATDYTQYLVTPQFFVDPLDDNLTFWYMPYSFGTEQFTVGISTTSNTDPLTVTWGTPVSVPGGGTWAQHVENLAAYVGQNVYAWVRYDPVYQYYLYTDLYEFPDGSAESFESVPGWPPSGWTQTTAGSGANIWYNGTSHDGACASIDDGPLNSTRQDEYLITPTIDCSAGSGTQLTVWSYFYRSTVSGDSTAQILGSIDDGATFPYEIVRWDLSDTSGDQAYDISAWADGQSQIKIAFRFSSTATSNDYDYWDLDDVWVGAIAETVVCFEGFEEMISGTGFPPPGWSEVIYGGTGTWTAETGPNPPPPPTYDGFFACADDDGAGSAVIMNTGLFTPSLDVSGIGSQQVNVAFSSHYNNIGADYCEVRTYSNAALEATVVTYIADHDMEESLWFDPSGYVDPSDVQVEFYYNDGGSWAWEWSIDNVVVSVGVPPPGGLDEVSGDDENSPGFQLSTPGFQGGNQGSLQNKLGFARKQ